jgi:transcriptional regulator with XRE-family HTH domain
MTRRISGRKQDREAQMIDAHVGQQVRQRRVLVGASQEQLGEHLGLTFQQVQKYEKGTNRISAGRLLQIAEFLGVRVESFFEGLALHGRLLDDDTDASSRQRVLTFAMSREGRAWNQVYLDAPHPRQRKIALDVLRLPTTPENT